MDPPSHSDNISSLLVVNHTMNETEDQLIETTSKDLCQTPDLASTRMQISDLLSTPPERLDHRMEKEMGESPDLPSLPYSSGMNPREKSKRLGEGFGMWSPTLSNMLSGNYLGEGRSGRSKLRTPRTLTRLMRQHRDSERHRHRGLNATIKEISRKIPGYEDASNETKIVKLQRIINYICHVEQRIMYLCEEQGLDLEYKNLFLLPHLPKVTDMRKTGSRSSPGGRSVSSVVTPRTSHRPSRVSSGRSVTYRSRCRRRVKLSSPSIDLKKGHVAASASTQSLRQSNPDVRNVALPAKDNLPTLQDDMTGDSVAMETEASSRSEDAVTVLTSSDNLPSVLHVTLLKEPENCAVNWLDYAASVDMTDVVTQELKDMCEGTKGTKDTVDILKCEEGAVSQIMDVTNDVATFHSYAKTPPTSVTLTDMVKRESEERGCLPEKCDTRISVTQQMVACSGTTSHPTMALRPPLYSLSNVTDNGQGSDSLQSHTSLHWQLYQVTGAPPSGQESVLRSDQLLLPPSDKMKPEDSIPCETTSNISAGGDEMENVQPSSCSSSRSGRIDHRKTSWMNGFMMYSRLHRKLYIEENPGVHTSHISKLMGHDWRQLTPTQQQPYREKAKLYIKQYLSPHMYAS